MTARLLLILLVLAAVSGCAATQRAQWRDPWQGDAPALGACLDLYRHVDDTVDAAGVGDAEWARVAGFPYLRVSRYLASFRDEVTGGTFDAWAEQMHDLDRRARAIEIGNLSDDDRVVLGGTTEAILASLDDCAAKIMPRDLGVTEGRAALRKAARVPDHYADWQRLAGLYPLTAIPIAWGSFAWRQGRAEVFERTEALDAATVYHPDGKTMDAADVAAVLASADGNPLGIPDPENADLDALFAAFAPVLAVEHKSPADRIGRVVWQEGKSVVDTDVPVAYRLVSHARVGGRTLLQLNYVFWFPARPKSGWFDILGGHMDGLIWRVTLGSDGLPILYDSIHPCGCYHQFYPARPMTRTDKWSVWNEGAAEPGRGPLPGAGQRVVIHLEARTHYISGLSLTGDAPAAAYSLLPYDNLRHLPLPDGGTRSLFAPNGLVRGTARAERFLFWPMGISSAGAMRQWGTHATAFVGKRHFDDPFLIGDSYRIEMP